MYLVCRRRRPASSPLSPYTTLFRSIVRARGEDVLAVRRSLCRDRRIEFRIEEHRAQAIEQRVERFAGAQRKPGARARRRPRGGGERLRDRKSTRLNSSHRCISYAVVGAPPPLHSLPTRRSSDLLFALAARMSWPCGGVFAVTVGSNSESKNIGRRRSSSASSVSPARSGNRAPARAAARAAAANASEIGRAHV